MSALLEIADLAVEYEGDQGAVVAIDGVDLAVNPAETVGIVGESGSGKSTLGLSIGRMLPGSARVVRGEIRVNGISVGAADAADIRRLRATELGFIFQDPMMTLDPTMRVGQQLRHVLPRGNRSDVFAELARVNLADPATAARSYPHELSGGMAQRVAIAMALARRPKLLVADEPTAALDASIRRSILELLFAQPKQLGLGLLFLSHDLRSVSRYCDRVAVMYAGRVVELGASREALERPVHPYTAALLRSAPGAEAEGERLEPIRGLPPLLRASSTGCAFAPRCSWATKQCRSERPAYSQLAGRRVLCHRAEEVWHSELWNDAQAVGER